jgi:hypothetical protein
MKNKILATVTALALLATATAAQADGYYRRGYEHRGGGGGNWAAPLVGGLIIGGMLGAMANQPTYAAPPQYYVPQDPVYVPGPYCTNQFVGYDVWQRPLYRRICQ